VVFDLEESQRQCGQCQTPMHKIGEDVGERLEFIPASLQAIEEVRPKYACAKGVVWRPHRNQRRPLRRGYQGLACWRTWQSANMEIIFR
jgi:transposase